MFYYLEGIVSQINQNLAVIDIGGAGYACTTTMRTLSHLEVGKKAKLYTYCNIKEDAFDIYGFYDQSERRCFEQLLTVSGVGPKAAISILSAATPESLAFAVLSNDEHILTAAVGVGKKLAQRILLELKDKVSKELPTIGRPNLSQPGSSSAAATPEWEKSRDVAAALAVLGYSPAEISAAMRNVDLNETSVEEIVRHILKQSASF